jgi:branched-chain amino acid transport system substrate-binding protein
MLRRLKGRDHVLLTDFGIGRFVQQDSVALTRPGNILGTVGYIAPECILGDEGDDRSDVYALACVIFECLTGESVFNAFTDVALCMAHANDPRPKPSDRRPLLGPRFDAALVRGLAIDPDKRFQTAAEFADALQAALRGGDTQPSPSRPSPALPAALDVTTVDRAGEELRVAPVTPPTGVAPTSLPHEPTVRSGERSTPREALTQVSRSPSPSSSTPRTRGSKSVLAAVAAGVVLVGIVAVVLAKGGGSAKHPLPAVAPKPGGTLTIYSSLPRSSGSQVTDMIKAMRLALEQAHGKAGGFSIKYKDKDDSVFDGSWTPEAVAKNAHEAARDASTAVYIGDFQSAATKISLPILSAAHVPQISPASDAVGLTSAAPGADPGEPAKYYPGGFRNYVSIVPKGGIQGGALVALMKRDGCTRVAMAHDTEVYGEGLARDIEASAREQALTIVFDEVIDKHAAHYHSLASLAASQRATCFVFSGLSTSHSVQVYKDVAAALPKAELYGPDALADPSFSDPEHGGIPARIAAHVRLTAARREPLGFGRSGRAFFTQYRTRYHADADPVAINGYEAMQLALDAIKRSRTGTRSDIVKALFATRNRHSALGTYSIDRNGDTTLRAFGVYGIKDAQVPFLGTMMAAPVAVTGK